MRTTHLHEMCNNLRLLPRKGRFHFRISFPVPFVNFDFLWDPRYDIAFPEQCMVLRRVVDPNQVERVGAIYLEPHIREVLQNELSPELLGASEAGFPVPNLY